MLLNGAKDTFGLLRSKKIDVSVMQHKNRSRYLATIDNEQSIFNICKYGKCKFEEAFLVLKPGKMLPFRGQLTSFMFIGKSRIYRMTKMSGPCFSSDSDCNAFLVVISNECCFGEAIRTRFEHVFISEFEIIKFSTEDQKF